MMEAHLPALLSPRAKLAPQAFLIRELADEAANPCARAAEADSVCFQSMFGSVRITEIRSGLRGRSDEVDYSRAPLQDFFGHAQTSSLRTVGQVLGYRWRAS